MNIEAKKTLTPTSHPAIRFEQVPIVEGPLSVLQEKRRVILDSVVERSMNELSGANPDLLLGEASYLERQRLKRVKKLSSSYLFTGHRSRADQKLWSEVKSSLLKKPGEANRSEVLTKVVDHYAEEIGGRYRKNIYRFAINAVPWGASWLLNAASVKRFLPWGMSESLESRLRIVGEVPHVQKLAKKGTIIMVPTHMSNIDSPLIGYIIYLMSLPPFAYGAGLNLFSNPVLSFFMGNLGAYTVDRKKNNTIYKSVLKSYSATILKDGVHSIFFPGGGRARSGAIETRLKLGLLGTGIQAQLENLKTNPAKSKYYVVPMVMSYHFVLEASSLIEEFLRGEGQHRFYGVDSDTPWEGVAFLNFFWKLFSSKSEIIARIGKPVDMFGNMVDEEGESIGPNGTTIDPARWLTTGGELKSEPQRDREYVRALGDRIVERYYKENTVLTSHLLAFSFFMALRRRYPDLDLFRFLRLSRAQRSLPYSEFLKEAELFHAKVKKLESQGELFLSEELRTADMETWIKDGLSKLGRMHRSKVVVRRGEVIMTDDMNLLYFYRNRLSGYGISLLGEYGQAKRLRGEHDQKGFLA